MAQVSEWEFPFIYWPMYFRDDDETGITEETSNGKTRRFTRLRK